MAVRSQPTNERPKLTPADKRAALREVAFVIEVEIEHLDDLLKFEKKEEKKGRYDSGGGDPLPEDLAIRFRAKLTLLKAGYGLLMDAIAKMDAAAKAPEES